MEVKNLVMSVSEYVKTFDIGLVSLDASYQRGQSPQWEKESQVKDFWTSIVDNVFIPQIVLRKIGEKVFDDGIKRDLYEVLDGGQRTRLIVKFSNGVYDAYLCDSKDGDFLSRQLNFAVVDADDFESQKLFEVLNGGVSKLTPLQVHKSRYNGALGASGLLSHPFFKSENKIKDTDKVAIILQANACFHGIFEMVGYKYLESSYCSINRRVGRSLDLLDSILSGIKEGDMLIAKRFLKRCHITPLLIALSSRYNSSDDKFDSVSEGKKLIEFFAISKGDKNEARLRYDAVCASATGSRDSMISRIRILKSYLSGSLDIKKSDIKKSASAESASAESVNPKRWGAFYGGKKIRQTTVGLPKSRALAIFNDASNWVGKEKDFSNWKEGGCGVQIVD